MSKGTIVKYKGKARVRKSKTANRFEVQERIRQTGIWLLHHTQTWIMQQMKEKWGLGTTQSYRYIKAAERDWKIYFEYKTRLGMQYHIAKRRQLRELFMSKGDYRGVLQVDMDEAKLMGVYPSEVHDVNLVSDFSQWLRRVRTEKEKNAQKKNKLLNGVTKRYEQDRKDRAD
jgi:hypothetical protein